MTGLTQDNAMRAISGQNMMPTGHHQLVNRVMARSALARQAPASPAVARRASSTKAAGEAPSGPPAAKSVSQ